MAITNEFRKRMLERLDPIKPTVGVGLTKVILLERYSDYEGNPDERQYEADGIYGGYKNITWKAVTDGTLKQDAELSFEVKQGKSIVGYVIIFYNGATEETGDTRQLSSFTYNTDGKFNIANITVSIN